MFFFSCCSFRLATKPISAYKLDGLFCKTYNWIVVSWLGWMATKCPRNVCNKIEVNVSKGFLSHFLFCFGCCTHTCMYLYMPTFIHQQFCSAIFCLHMYMSMCVCVYGFAISVVQLNGFYGILFHNSCVACSVLCIVCSGFTFMALYLYINIFILHFFYVVCVCEYVWAFWVFCIKYTLLMMVYSFWPIYITWKLFKICASHDARCWRFVHINKALQKYHDVQHLGHDNRHISKLNYFIEPNHCISWGNITYLKPVT